MSTLANQVRQAAPAIDSIVTEYAAGYVRNVVDNLSDAFSATSLDIPSEIQFVTSLLLNAGADKSAISKLKSTLETQLNELYQDDYLAEQGQCRHVPKKNWSNYS